MTIESLSLQRIAHDRNSLEIRHDDVCCPHHVLKRELHGDPSNIGRKGYLSDGSLINSSKDHRYIRPQLRPPACNEVERRRSDGYDDIEGQISRPVGIFRATRSRNLHALLH